MQLPSIKFVNSKTIKEKWSWVVVKMGKKQYFGSAKCHEDDAWSEFTGCRYAEQRAEINALKAYRKQKKAECENIRKFIHSLECYKDFDKESPTAKTVYRQLNKRIKEVNDITDEINQREFNLRIAIRQQDRVSNKFKSKEDN